VVAIGCWKNRGSESTSGSGTCTGAAGAFGAAFFFFLVFLGPAAAPPAAPQMRQQQASKRSHCQICMKDPEEPDAVEPELEPELDFWIDALEESFLKELE